ncbi:MAG: hypothetical protein AB7Q29_14950 [Vicinamibacterales bacterium]
MIRTHQVEFESATLHLISKVLEALYFADLPDQARVIERFLVTQPGLLIARPAGPGITVFYVAEMGELVLRQVLDVARRPGATPVAQRRGIEEALWWAGLKPEGSPG